MQGVSTWVFVVGLTRAGVLARIDNADELRELPAASRAASGPTASLIGPAVRSASRQ